MTRSPIRRAAAPSRLPRVGWVNGGRYGSLVADRLAVAGTASFAVGWLSDGEIDDASTNYLARLPVCGPMTVFSGCDATMRTTARPRYTG